MKKIIIMLMASCIIFAVTACTPTETEETNIKEEVYQVQDEIIEETIKETELIIEELPDPVEINADFEVTTNADGSFIIKTNLPDETELMLTLNGRGYIAQGEAVVEGGTAISERFTDKGEQLIGDYTLEVLMPVANAQTDYVKHFIGKNGEYLTGPYVKGAMGSVVVSKQFDVSFKKNTEDEVINDDYNTEVDSADNHNYYRAPYGERYHLDPKCPGKNSYKTNDITGLTPCQKCVR